MERSDLALRRARRAYAATHLRFAATGIAIAAGITSVAYGLHHVTTASWLFAALLAATLAALGWRGGSLRRGALAGVLAGLPPLVVPSLVFALSHGGHCPDCEIMPVLPCMLVCFTTSALLGTVVGHRASRDPSPRRFAPAAIATAALTGLLGCGTTGLGGATGIVIGLVAGGVTGWVVAARTAHV